MKTMKTFCKSKPWYVGVLLFLVIGCSDSLEQLPNQKNSRIIKKYSKIWWLRRSEAFSYLKIIMNKKKKIFIYSFDYYLTNFLTFLIKKKI